MHHHGTFLSPSCSFIYSFSFIFLCGQENEKLKMKVEEIWEWAKTSRHTTLKMGGYIGFEFVFFFAFVWYNLPEFLHPTLLDVICLSIMFCGER
jgi:hypothetical protein